MTTIAPLLLPYNGAAPRFGAHPLLSSGASLLGDVELGADAIVAAGAVIRGDGHFVRAGDGFSIGENATVHIAQGAYPAIIGNRVAMGRNSVVHACTVGGDCVIEDNTVILDGSVVEDNVLIEANSVLFPKTKLASGFVYAGAPAKPVRVLAPAEREERGRRLRNAAANAPAFAAGGDASVKAAETAFIARTAHLSGQIELKDQSSLFFGCVLDAGQHGIEVCENTNIQDNSRILCISGGVFIGGDVTIGHNVLMQDCRIGERSLIGIGATVASGTVIEDDVLLAAGAVTLSGQRLESSWVWGGRPARPLSPLDGAKRSMFRVIIEHYRGYAHAYRLAQQQLHGAGRGIE